MSDKKSPYGAGFMLRMGILLLLLGLVAGGFYYDTNVLIPNAAKTINETMNLITEETDDGRGLPKDKIQQTVGFAPTQTRTSGEYEIETYKFARAIPFAKGEYIEVVYQDGALVKIFPNEDFSPEKMKSDLKITSSPRDAKLIPAVPGGGAPRRPSNNDADEEGDDHDDDEEEEGDDHDEDDHDDDEEDDEDEDDEDEDDDK